MAEAASGSILAPGSASSSSSSSQHLKVAAFNIRTLGVTKMGKPEVVERLVEIIARYDIVLIQEIRDASGQAIADLLNAVNRASASDPYEMELSMRLGRKSYKEQYAYFYRPSKVTVVATYQYPDPYDVFERPPFCVRFKTVGGNEFGYMGVHVKPSLAVVEIDFLSFVYDVMPDSWKMKDFLIGGDLNADAPYVGPQILRNIRLRWSLYHSWLWLIEDGVDTTVCRAGHTYDRLIISNYPSMKLSYLSDSAIAYRFDDEMHLDYDQAKAVSDHVPVEMMMG